MLKILYHANCADGFCSAWLCYCQFGNKAQYIPVQYGQDPPEDLDGCEVLIVDFSYKREVILQIEEQTKWLVVLDHHKTAKDEIADLDYCIFHDDKSGARITWEYLWDKFKDFQEWWKYYGRNTPHWLVKYTEDRDLWRWVLPDSRPVNAALRSYPFDFEKWDWISSLETSYFKPEGEAILRSETMTVEGAVKNPHVINFKGHKVPILNATMLISEIGNAFCRDYPFSITYFFRKEDGKIILSFRSAGHVDVSAFAKELGGGGHHNAAGAPVDFEFFTRLLAGGC